MKIHCEIKSTNEIYSLNIQSVGNGFCEVYPNKPFYSYNEIVKITAKPDKRWVFLTFRGASISKNPEIYLTIKGNASLIARFNKANVSKRIYISDVDLSHADAVKNSFRQGYFDSLGVNFNDNDIHISLSNPINFLEFLNLGSEVFIRSTTGFQNIKPNLDLLYPSQSFMPAGSNEHIYINVLNGIMPVTIITGAGNNSNNTGYELEHFGYDPSGNYDDSSFSNAYIAGIFCAAYDSYMPDYSAIRYYSRKNKTLSIENGYGFIQYSDIINAGNLLEYNNNILIDPAYYRKLDPYMLQ